MHFMIDSNRIELPDSMLMQDTKEFWYLALALDQVMVPCLSKKSKGD